MFHHYLLMCFDLYVLFLIDSGEVPADGDKASTENSKKRKLKTPIQVMALENFYNGKLWLCYLHLFLYANCICFTGVIFFFYRAQVSDRRYEG